ncbi:MAG: hypothetical protein KC729_18730, partial [Candidatus Eisenbacteria bacterium]|nr:hypothetical protein [Candidatus Eisenbacteria bacterium]
RASPEGRETRERQLRVESAMPVQIIVQNSRYRESIFINCKGCFLIDEAPDTGHRTLGTGMGVHMGADAGSLMAGRADQRTSSCR